jgi:hypothetical protein
MTPEEEQDALALDEVFYALNDAAEGVSQAMAAILPLVKANDAKGFVSQHDRPAV